MIFKAEDLRENKLLNVDNYEIPEVFRDDIEGVLVLEEHIKRRIERMAHDIHSKFSGMNPLVVPLLDGAAKFYGDLFTDRHYAFQIETEFLKVESGYEQGTESTGVVKFPDPAQIERIMEKLSGNDRGILLVEDIVDTGRSVSLLREHLIENGVESDRISLAALLNKPSRRLPEFEDLWIDFLGFVIPDGFVVGYGMDFNKGYRNLGDLCVLKPKVYED
jgi:hypoxanthine phosphoribosyltransferase